MSAKRLTIPNRTTTRSAAERDDLPSADPEPMAAILRLRWLRERASCLDASRAEDARGRGEGVDRVREHFDADAGLHGQNGLVNRLAHRRAGHEGAHQGVVCAVDDDRDVTLC